MRPVHAPARPAGPQDLLQEQTPVPAGQGRPAIAARRQEFRAWRIGLPDPDRFVFLDEPWVKTNAARLYGWGPTHRRVVEAVPHGHGMATTSPGALRPTGLVAPRVIDGAVDGEISRAYVEPQAVEALRPGDIVVTDDPSSHQVAGVREAIAGAGAGAAYRPPSRPDSHPIEQAFSKVEQGTRERKPRTKPACDGSCGESLDWFPADECRRYVRHAGYGPQE